MVMQVDKPTRAAGHATNPSTKKLKLDGGAVECSAEFSSQGWRAFYAAIITDKVAHVQQLKHDGTTTVYIAEIEGITCVVKRYNTKNRWHFVRRGFRRSRADICFELAEIYNQAGIKTPEPIAKIQAYFGPFKLRSWYLCRYQQGALLTDWVEQQVDQDAEKGLSQSLYQAVRNLFSKLASNQLSHGDMKATNLIWQDNQLLVIDLDAARLHRSESSHKRALQKDYQRFMLNWQSFPQVLTDFKASIQMDDLGKG